MTLNTDTERTDMHTLNDLADRGLSDSARWFPELHRRGQIGLAVHYALGLGGEAGELLEAPDDPDEFADVLIYALDLARILGGDLDAAYDNLPDEIGPASLHRIAIHAGLVLNYVKKLNRGDYGPEQIAEPVATHVALIVALARNMIGNVLDVIEHKREQLEDRWG